jgi:hypothetical protein
MRYQVTEYRAFDWKSTAGVNETASTAQENHETTIIEAENPHAALLSAWGHDELPEYTDSHHGHLWLSQDGRAGLEDRATERGIAVEPAEEE